MKTANVKKLKMVYTNIIFFPSHLCRIAGTPGKLTARAQLPTVTNAAASRRTSIELFPHFALSPSESVRDYLAEILGILSRRPGIDAAMTNSRMDSSDAACAGRLTLLSHTNL